MDDFGLSRGNVQQYSPGVLVGNWYEDMKLREDQLKLYRGQKNATAQEKGASAFAATTTTPAGRLQEATKITAENGSEVCFGQPYLILNSKTQAALAMDVLPSSSTGGSASCVLTAS